jgi:2'-5' RNA ligase
MSVIRAFIAIDLPVEIHHKLEQASGHLTQQLNNLPLRWVPITNIHLTLKFLGEVSETNVETITEIIESEAIVQPPFEISIGGLGVYPNNRRPRVIWVGIEAPECLTKLQRRIDIEVARLGYARDKRSFSPHLTLGRVSRNASYKDIRKISKRLRNEKLGFLGVARVNDIHLYRSDLNPDGAVYSKLYSSSLKSES